MAVERVIPFRKPEPELADEDSKLAEEARTATHIVSGVRNGRSGAETELVKRYSHGLRYILARRFHQPEQVDDLLQETLSIAIQKLRETNLDNPERLAGYLRGIAIRVALNAGRRRQREPYGMEIDAIAQIPDREPGQFEQVAREQTLAAVQKLLKTMPMKRDRELLTRLYVQDQDKQDICDALGLDSLHFNRVLFRAKKRFRKLLEASERAADLAPESGP